MILYDNALLETLTLIKGYLGTKIPLRHGKTAEQF